VEDTGCQMAWHNFVVATSSIVANIQKCKRLGYWCLWCRYEIQVKRRLLRGLWTSTQFISYYSISKHDSRPSHFIQNKKLNFHLDIHATNIVGRAFKERASRYLLCTARYGSDGEWSCNNDVNLPPCLLCSQLSRISRLDRLSTCRPDLCDVIWKHGKDLL
jgi:hypothetical protein